MPLPIDYVRYAADMALGIPAKINLRPYEITLKYITWTGERPGIGSQAVIETRLYNDGYVNPRFRQVSKEEVAMSGGHLRDQDVCIGPFVFPYEIEYASGGINPMIFSPTIGEMYVNIEGPNFPEGGLQFKKIWDNTEGNVVYRVYLRNTATTLP